MGVSIEEDADLSSHGDAYITLIARSRGFTGHNDLWVLGSEMVAFCQQLLRLNQALKGEARLTGISPGELEVKVRSVSSGGHIAVEGATGYHVQGRHGLYFHAVTFGFEFDQDQLQRAVALPWVRWYAGNQTG